MGYEGDAANEPDPALADDISQINSTKVVMDKLSTPLQWHQLDPFDAAEQARSEGVCGYQGNRNPLVDRPGWVA